MPYFIVTWLITAISLLVTAYFIPGFHVSGFGAAAIAAVVIGLANTIVRPVLSILTFPITLLTLGLFSFILNALMIWLASVFSPGFRIDGFIPALMGSLALSLISGVLHFFWGSLD